LKETEATKMFLRVLTAILLSFSLTPTVLASDPGAINVSQPEVMVVFINARTCPICAKVRPILDDLENEYKPKVRFVRLDVTDIKDRQDSRQVAKSLQLGAFYAFYEDMYPCVGVFDEKGKCLKEIYGLSLREKYVAQIEKALRVH
jgi:thiol-disulfide isomerase/thioredoxin